MKSTLFPALFALLCLAGSCRQAGSGKSQVQAAPELPNIVYIVSDDQAWTDYGFMRHSHIRTPHLDSLALQGRTFTRGYSVAPLCSPSIATLITGVYPQQHGITGNDPVFSFDGKQYSREWMLERSKHYNTYLERFRQYPTLAELLKERGYLSFQSGKWWAGSWEDGGFTGGMTHGDPANNGRHGDEGLAIGRKGMQPVFDFIDQATGQNKPFFLWYAPFLPHAPHTPPDSLLTRYLEKAPSGSVARYWAMCEWFDITVGQLLQKLEEKGITENTLVVYACDNGWIQDPQRPNAYMPGSKQDPNEMGIRTPLIFKWPARVEPGLDTATLVSTIDIMPTVLGAASINPSPDMPGLNVLDAEALRRRTAIFALDFDHDMVAADDPGASLQHRMILTNPWKLIVPDTANEPGKQPELYNIFEDPFERKDLAGSHPEIVRELGKRLDDWWTP
ncbi:MAG TPA: sulfatase-like hydrolase/transferase [Anseongella sp.]|nr:sulfatase-like hydrolase/transferase [Anseongella sp.]